MTRIHSDLVSNNLLDRPLDERLTFLKNSPIAGMNLKNIGLAFTVLTLAALYIAKGSDIVQNYVVSMKTQHVAEYTLPLPVDIANPYQPPNP